MIKGSVWQYAFVTLLSLAMAACQDGSTEPVSTSTVTVSMGSGSGASFVNGVLAISAMQLPAGGTATVAATLVDGSGTLYTSENVSISFSSDCSLQGLSTIDSPVTTSAGTAVATYLATGCIGSDTITARATVNGVQLSATGTLSVQAPAGAGTIHFVSAIPSQIGVSGVGLNETSEVSFKVLDGTSNPVANVAVNFSLDDTLGGGSLLNSSAVSDADGKVATTVHSGSTATSVRVIAVLASDATITAQSDSLLISNGLPSQDNISLTASNLNPEAWDYDGNKVTLTVYAADAFHVPVPNGSEVFFNAEGGQIQASCLTQDGRCSVEWTSSTPRPADGRVTITAFMQGEEGFIDFNANGRFDDAEWSTVSDLPELFYDANENGVHDANEGYKDANMDGSYSAGDGLYNGLLCVGPTLCASSPVVDIRDSLVLIMAGSVLTISSSADPIIAGEVAGISVCDVNGSMPPSGTTVTLETDNGTLALASSYTVPVSNASGCYVVPVAIAADATSSVGTLTVTAVTPQGMTSYAYIAVND